VTWIRVDDDVIDHAKLDHLAELLGCDRTTAVGLMVGVWGYAKKYHPTGDLTGVRLAHLHRKLGWTTAGVGGNLSPNCPVGVPLLSLGPIRDDVRAVLLEARLMDRLEDGRLVLHDWDEYNGPDADRKRKARERKRLYREQQRESQAEISPVSVPRSVPRKRGQKRDNVPHNTTRGQSPPLPPADAHASAELPPRPGTGAHRSALERVWDEVAQA